MKFIAMKKVRHNFYLDSLSFFFYFILLKCDFILSCNVLLFPIHHLLPHSPHLSSQIVLYFSVSKRIIEKQKPKFKQIKQTNKYKEAKIKQKFHKNCRVHLMLTLFLSLDLSWISHDNPKRQSIREN